MTNTKFRKRALLSSVAMLLVALVAIGSATFAWFTTSPTANATGLKLMTTAGAGLEIKTATDTRGWKKTSYLNFDAAAYTADETTQSKTTAFNIQPASYVGSNTFLSVEADNAYDEVGKDTAIIGGATVQNNTSSAPLASTAAGVYKEQVDLRVTGGNAKVISLDSVAINVNENAIDTKTGVRVLVTETDGTVIGNYAATVDTGNDTVFKAAHGDGSTTYLTAKADLGTLAINNKSTAAALNGGTATTTESVYVYVFLNGFDGNVFSNIVDGSTLIDSIQLNFSIPTT